MTTLAELQGLLDPNRSRALGGLLRRVSADYGQAEGRRLRKTLGEIASPLAGQPATVVFAGHFSAGKSSLINALLGQSLLPTDDLPETGVPCELRAGPRNRIEVTTRTGTTVVPWRADALRRYVSLYDDQGGERAQARESTWLRVDLRHDIPAPGSIWIDSPGLNDTELTAARASAVAKQADVLIWVFNSNVPVALSEAEFLQEHRRSHSAASLMLVVNMFLRADTKPEWSSSLSRYVPLVESRISELLGRDIAHCQGPMFVSARASRDDPDSFGLAELKQLVVSLDSEEHPRVRAVRLHRAASRLSGLAADLDATAAQEAAQIAEIVASHRAEAAERRRARALFRQRVCSEVEAEWGRRVQTARSTWDSARGDDQPCGDMAARLADVLKTLSTDLNKIMVDRIDAVARTTGQERMTPASRAELSELVGAPEVKLPSLPQTPVKKPPTGAGALIGGIVGSLIAPGAGTWLGAAAGAALGRAVGSTADSSSAAESEYRLGVQRAAAAAFEDFDTRAQIVREIAMSGCLAPDPPRQEPMSGAYAELCEHLRQDVLVPLRKTLTTTRRKLSG